MVAGYVIHPGEHLPQIGVDLEVVHKVDLPHRKPKLCRQEMQRIKKVLPVDLDLKRVDPVEDSKGLEMDRLGSKHDLVVTRRDVHAYCNQRRAGTKLDQPGMTGQELLVDQEADVIRERHDEVLSAVSPEPAAKDIPGAKLYSFNVASSVEVWFVVVEV